MLWYPGVEMFLSVGQDSSQITLIVPSQKHVNNGFCTWCRTRFRLMFINVIQKLYFNLNCIQKFVSSISERLQSWLTKIPTHISILMVWPLSPSSWSFLRTNTYHTKSIKQFTIHRFWFTYQRFQWTKFLLYCKWIMRERIIHNHTILLILCI